MPRVLALTVRPPLAADVRYRILQYIPYFRKVGIEVDQFSMLSDRMYRRRQSGGRIWIEAPAYVWFYLKRLLQIPILVRRYDAVWIGRELSPIGPPFLERLLFRTRKRIVLDIDDAVFLRDETTGSFIHHHLRDFGKFAATASGYDSIVCGNAFLADYFRPFNPRVAVIPTVVSALEYSAIERIPAPRVRIGWIGTLESAPHLKLVSEAAGRLTRRGDMELHIVGLPRPLPGLDMPGILYYPWVQERELSYFQHFDIGIMPLEDIEFSKGKCAFKAIQYMAAGIPVVASPVGANLEVIRDGENGFLADTADEWTAAIERLANDAVLCRQMGQRGREIVRDHYCAEMCWERYAAVFFGDA